MQEYKTMSGKVRPANELQLLAAVSRRKKEGKTLVAVGVGNSSKAKKKEKNALHCLISRVSGEWKTAAASKISKTLFTAVWKENTHTRFGRIGDFFYSIGRVIDFFYCVGSERLLLLRWEWATSTAFLGSSFCGPASVSFCGDLFHRI